MRLSTHFTRWLWGWLLGLALGSTQAAPPQDEAVRLLLQAKTQMDSGAWRDAAASFEEASRLPVRLPESFDFHYGVALLRSGQPESAQEHLKRYLVSHGGGPKFFQEAHAALSQAQSEATEAQRKRDAEAAYRQKMTTVGYTFKDCPDCPDMVVLPAGRLDQVGRKTASFDLPVFAMGRTEVTQAQWRAVMGSNPSANRCSDCPVEKISFRDAQSFADKLSRLTGRKYRLPNFWEWVYACRAGSAYDPQDAKLQFCGTDDPDEAYSYGQFSTPYRDRTRPVAVAGRRPNAWGLYDMSGNVYEWVDSCRYGECLLLGGGVAGPVLVLNRLVYQPPGYTGEYLGLRILRELP